MFRDDEDGPTPEFRPMDHPDVMFRAHSGGSRYRVIHLGGEDYWMHGVWTAHSEGRVVLVKDRVFRISEFRFCLASLDIASGVGDWSNALS